MYKILIVGGSGFIGSHVADKLTEKNYKVSLYDVEDSPYKLKDQKMIIGNTLDIKKLNDVINMGFDYVYNFSSIADINEANNNIESLIDINIKGHINLMRACANNRVKRYIYASSLYVYSEYGSMYKASKQAAELFIEAFNEIEKLDFTVARCGTVYGPRSQEWNGFYKLIKGIVKDKKLVFEGSGDEIRNFIHVEDMAELFVKLVDDKYINKYVIINGDERYTGKQFVQLLEEIFGNSINKSTFKYKNKKRPDHYVVSPYKFFSRVVKNLSKDSYINLGQGILDLANEIENKS
tara:strand:+ start:27882 stop:28763 length:882 start_codon:yes stop_codon:yes gene_type:complete